MNLTMLNACLAGGWLLLTVGGFLISASTGFLIGGAVLLALTIGMALRFGVYQPKAPASEKAEA
jgi:hypothetical protein